MRALPLPLILAAGLAACADVGKYVWVDDYAPPAATDGPRDGYVIAQGDTLQVRVFNQDAMSAKAKVRADGMVTLPFLNDVKAAGYTPTVLAEQLQTRFKDFVNTPVVTISLEEARPQLVSVLGEVARPGQFPLAPARSSVLEALALAGGLTEYAKKDRIFVLRQGDTATRIRFRYEALSHADGRAPGFRLQDGDVIVVE